MFQRTAVQQSARHMYAANAVLQCLSRPRSHTSRTLKTLAGLDGQGDGSPFSAASNNRETIRPAHPATTLSSPSRGEGGGGRRISWETPLASSSPLGSPRTDTGKGVGSNRTPGSNGGFASGEENPSSDGGDEYNRGLPKPATALGWSDGFASLPEVQMQVLVEVGKLVRASARKRQGENPCE